MHQLNMPTVKNSSKLLYCIDREREKGGKGKRRESAEDILLLVFLTMIARAT
jgi:hypothetical protein